MNIASAAALILILAGVITCIPFARANKRSLLGYKAICPFAPISSVALITVGAVVWLVGNLA